MSGLEVIEPGLLSLIQDNGRYGVGDLGLSPGGAIDKHAFHWGNQLVGNKESDNASAIEITLGNAKFKALANLKMAICGAEMHATIDGEKQSNWHSFYLYKGQVLSFGFASKGLRSYLCVEAGFDVPQIYGSSCVVVRNKIGGLITKNNQIGLGNNLQQGDLLQANKVNNDDTHITSKVPDHYIPDYKKEITLDIIESYQSHLFSKKQKKTFYASTFKITPHSDRMGIRLSGPDNQHEIKGLISEGIALGSIQIPPDGQPIILLNDRQTLGGYPKIGCVTQYSIAKLAQSTPGTTVRFKPVPIESATQQLKEFLTYFNDGILHD